MIPHPSLHWNEILAAYADGEFEGRDDLAILKTRVEEWLTRHPEAQDELTRQRQLKQMWRDTAPPDPAPETWRAAIEQIARTPALPDRKAKGRRRTIIAASALAACLALAITIVSLPRPPVPVVFPPQANLEDDEPLLVAAGHEVEILNVDGADTHTLVVGQLPVQGSLELAGHGDVSVTSVQPAAHDNMMPEVRLQGPGRPMIWARLETD